MAQYLSEGFPFKVETPETCELNKKLRYSPVNRGILQRIVEIHCNKPRSERAYMSLWVNPDAVLDGEELLGVLEYRLHTGSFIIAFRYPTYDDDMAVVYTANKMSPVVIGGVVQKLMKDLEPFSRASQESKENIAMQNI